MNEFMNNIYLKKRIFLFILLAIILAVILFPLRSLSDLSPEYLTFNGMYPWAVLFLCLVFLISKRHENPLADTSPASVAFGATVVAAAFFLPAFALEFEVFRLLLGWAGLAFVFFGGSAVFPALLLCIYGFGISFPKLVEVYAGTLPARSTAWITYQIGHLFFPISLGDSAIFMLTSSGEKVMLLINAACSGSASMSVFLVIFMLMSLDMPLRREKLAIMLFFGIAGTAAQNILRIVVLMFVGYYFGPEALGQGESIAGYVIFPLWYILFAFTYMEYAKKSEKYK